MTQDLPQLLLALLAVNRHILISLQYIPGGLLPYRLLFPAILLLSRLLKIHSHLALIVQPFYHEHQTEGVFGAKHLIPIRVASLDISPRI